MEKNEIIERLSSYFRLSESEAQNFYSEIFSKNTENGKNPLFDTGESAVRHFIEYANSRSTDDNGFSEIPFQVQTDENQLELEYDSFTEHRYKAEKEIVREESKNRIIKSKPDITLSQQESAISAGTVLKEAGHQKDAKTDSENDIKHTAEDNSYYLWYKDAESNESETETLSFEYELMYQGSKESEYQSKMKIYAGSFALFFSFVLVMLLLSPVIYKKYFVTENFKSLEQTFKETGNKDEQKAVPNTLDNFQVTKEKNAYSAFSLNTPDEQEVNIQRDKKEQDIRHDDNNVIQTKTQEKPEIPQNELSGLIRAVNGWQDDKYNVLYVQLRNGKYTIQESSWNSYEKAGKRVSEIELLGIPGLKGSIEEISLGEKGKWYRVRFGEFSTLEEARRKVKEFMNL